MSKDGKRFCDTTHNPCNLIWSAKNRWQGQTGNYGRFVVFSEDKYGFRAFFRIVWAYVAKHNCRTITAIIARYAPPGENSTNAYIKFVCEKLRIDPYRPVSKRDTVDASFMMALALTMAHYEQGCPCVDLTQACSDGFDLYMESLFDVRSLKK